MAQTTVIYPLSGKARMRPNRSFKIGALDCETIPLKGNNPKDALDGKVDFVTWAHEDGVTFGEVRNMKKFLKYLLDGAIDADLLLRTIWYSHNGEYDWRYLIQAFKQFKDLFNIFANERCHGVLYQIELQDKDGNRVTRFRDSMALFPRSLRDFTKAFSPDVPKGEIDFEKVVFNRLNPKHVEYARTDVSCLVISLKNFDAFIYAHYGVHLSATASGTSYQAWLRTIPKTVAHWRLASGIEAFMRKTYVGGMVQLNCSSMETYYDVKCFDINSSYPASMRLGVPIGKAYNTVTYKEGKSGFYKIEFKTPYRDFEMPVLWHRNEAGELSFPNNASDEYISSFATSLEIDYARGLGYQINVIEGYWFPDGLGLIFNDYIDKCERLRLDPGIKGTPLEQVVKQMQNSLYGRFGMRPDGRQIRVAYDDPLGDWWPVIDEETGQEIPDVYYMEEERNAEYMLPHWASWITAGSRILLDKGKRALFRAGLPVLYCDTDSLYVQGPAEQILAIGELYGLWKLEAIYQEIRFHAPKYYTGKTLDGLLFGKCKGIKKPNLRRQEILEKLHNGLPYVEISHRSNGVLTWARTGKLGEECTRTPTKSENVYSHIIENGMFKPLRV